MKRLLVGPGMIEAARKTAPNAMFIDGPAMDILAISFKRADPEITTAPGAMSLIGEITESKVIIAPQVVNLNSAQSPLLCAINL